MKPTLREGENEPSCPEAGIVAWKMTVREGALTRRGKRSKVFRRKNWKDARDDAMQYFGVEAGDLEFEKEQGK